MIIEQIWTDNALRNFNYLIACEETGEAVAIDPLDSTQCLQRAKQHGWNITTIINTHEHGDHTGGNLELIRQTGAKVLAHAGAKGRIPGMTTGLSAGDIVSLGKTVEITILDTPGHTMSHVCMLVQSDEPALFSGDTLFNAGAGNCHNGGNPAILYKTFCEQLADLPDSTRIYPGHEYLGNNLRFSLDREPGNRAAAELLENSANMDPNRALVTTWGLEKRINPFLRLSKPGIIAKLHQEFPQLAKQSDPKTVFLKLRELRNRW
ncbi:MAG TPA: hydroxyacylglutathione hydrolase [Gammaproteobacteria bacterium]|nr:hydroxyacylglutathione hydrolase [Gammaproteobacteria bacterium]